MSAYKIIGKEIYNGSEFIGGIIFSGKLSNGCNLGHRIKLADGSFIELPGYAYFAEVRKYVKFELAQKLGA